MTTSQQKKLQNFIFNQAQVKLTRLKYAHVKNLTALFKNENIEENVIKTLSKNIQMLKCKKGEAKSSCICGMNFHSDKSIFKHRKRCEIFRNNPEQTESKQIEENNKYSEQIHTKQEKE